MRQKRLFVVSAVCYLCSSASVLMMGAGDLSGKNGSATLAVLSAVIFWLSLMIAITAQLLLRRLQKPYRRKRPFREMALSPPAVFFEVGFLTALAAVIVLTVLTMGKFQRKDGKIILKVYTRSFNSNRREVK